MDQSGRQRFQPDAHQREVIARLDGLRDQLQDASTARAGWLRRRRYPIPGIYLWGAVGRGKTWLMDRFFDELPNAGKQRFHFHRFMQYIHSEMQRLQGQSDPMERVAHHVVTDTRVLCLDEFNVIDIADAVMLAGLLRGLFGAGLTLVATSNHPPELLYRGGIQRASFLPAIDLLNRHTRVLQLQGDVDYRRQVAEIAGVYHWPLGAQSEAGLWQAFERLSEQLPQRDGVVQVMSRDIPYRYRSGDLVWFDFEALCGPPRSQFDYIELARNHHTVIVSDIPRLDGSSDDRSRRFICLIDEFYDRGVKLLLSASVRPEMLYCGERLAFEFQRTVSRLLQMQTADYLSRPHLG
jgi:cell division protein ZapE